MTAEAKRITAEIAMAIVDAVIEDQGSPMETLRRQAAECNIPIDTLVLWLAQGALR